MAIIQTKPKQSSSIFLGSSVVTAVFVEVTPLILSESQPPPSCSNFICKHVLQKQTLQSSLSTTKEGRIIIEWKDGSIKSNDRNGLSPGYLFQTTTVDDNESSSHRATFPDDGSRETFPIFYLPSEDPSILNLQPCCIVTYATQHNQNSTTDEVIVTPASLVRVLPPRVVAHYYFCSNNEVQGWNSNPGAMTSKPLWNSQQDFLQKLSGELGNDFLSDDLQAEIVRNHNQDTIQELTLRLSLLLSQPITIGTTSDAFRLKKEWVSRSTWMDQVIQSHCEAKNIPLHVRRRRSINVEQQSQSTGQKKTIGPTSLQWEPSLIIHSPNHADGKTLLAQAIANRVGCASVHIVRPGPLLAKYGISADAALESLLHAIIVSAAVKNKSVCIILDHLDAMMPPRLSGRSSAGDAAVPIFNAIASYLSNITGSLQRLHEFPFPVKNSLYNPSGTGGRVLSVRLCLVGIVTCPDDGWRSSQSDAGGSSTILDSMVGGRYRIPSLTAKTRFAAFSGAFEQAELVLNDAARARLPVAAASAAWAKGSAFCRVANQLRQIVSAKGLSTSATAQDLERAFACTKNDSADFALVSFQATDEETPLQETGKSLLESVGGNTQAKLSLEDALALDPRKRRMLARFGLSPPTGILLYGPPGCGKTLLAKAVAKLLKAPRSGQTDSLSLGGTFISLSSSDIIRAEIGTSEKMVVSAFEFADKNAPAVIFLDEFQALFTERSRGGSGKLATTLLQCLDDIKRWRDVDNSTHDEDNSANADSSGASTEGSRVIVLGATNSPWMVDSAFLRSGRFDRVVHVGLPTDTERESILLVHIGRMRVRGRDDSAVLKLLCKNIAGKTAGFSGADLAALCRAAAIRALIDVGDDGEIEERHFIEALYKDLRASSDDNLVQRLLKWGP